MSEREMTMAELLNRVNPALYRRAEEAMKSGDDFQRRVSRAFLGGRSIFWELGLTNDLDNSRPDEKEKQR